MCRVRSATGARDGPRPPPADLLSRLPEGGPAEARYGTARVRTSRPPEGPTPLGGPLGGQVLVTVSVPRPSDGELALLEEARDAARALREGWWAAQVGSLGREPREVAGTPRAQELEAAADRAERRYRAACRRRWPKCRGARRPVTPWLPGL